MNESEVGALIFPHLLAPEHAVAVAGGRFHKAVSLRRPVSKSRQSQALCPGFGIHVVNPSALHQHVVLAIHQVEKIVLFGFLAWVGHGLSRQQGRQGGDQEGAKHVSGDGGISCW